MTRHPGFATLASLCIATGAGAQVAPTGGWSVGTPESVGMRSAPLAELSGRMKTGAFGAVDRMVVARNGTLVWNDKFQVDYRDLSRGRKSPIGCGVDACTSAADSNQFNYLHPAFHPWYQGRAVHTLQSVTKSVTSVLIGIAIGRGEIRSVDEPLLSFFGDYDLSNADARLRKATLADLLTMRSGIEWHENDRPLDDTNTTVQLEKSADWIRFTLSQPMDSEPGTKWVYNSGGSALMAEIIRKSTGKHVDVYAREHLFGPLGIADFHWKKTPTGHPDTEGGLYLEAVDLAKIGQLYLDGGEWRGRRILPESYVRASVARHVDRVNAGGQGYGYQWWRVDRGGAEVWAGNGFGGQFLVVIPQHRIVGVINSWNVFGARVPGSLGPFIDALLASVAPAP